ncbi:hypothetical protein SY85_23575 [Flavisolibacter tropicus]|uniref:Glycosyltransferase 2-like domain-containing protein n=2 Tax=Flavisolibacter tropicus TaxID=1492898 RepID=A0A172U1E7_9BACT|nr:hypothetical protein SY85_23575 [Flavisolibacter tropicus]
MKSKPVAFFSRNYFILDHSDSMNMVSIILLTYNRSKLLQECIHSILNQTYTNFELLIIDDGSDDDTRERVLEIKDTRISYFYQPRCGYTGRLKNYALSKAKGSFIAYMDSDDLWKEDKLQKQMDLFIKNPEIGFSITDVTTFKGEEILSYHAYPFQNTVRCESIFSRITANRFLIYGSVLVMKRSCFDKVGHYDETMRSGDFNFHMRLAYHYDCGILYEPLVLRRVHDTNMSKEIPFENYEEYLATYQYLYNNGMVKKKPLRQAKGIAHLKLGKLHEGRGNRKKALTHYLNSFTANLFYPRYVYSLVKIYLKVKPQKPL